MMKCFHYSELWCDTHLGPLPRPLTAAEMALAVEQANTPSSASFPKIAYTWDRLEIDMSELIMSKALPELPTDLSQEKECEAMQLQLDSSGQDHIWGSFLKVPHAEGMFTGCVSCMNGS